MLHKYVCTIAMLSILFAGCTKEVWDEHQPTNVQPGVQALIPTGAMPCGANKTLSFTLANGDPNVDVCYSTSSGLPIPCFVSPLPWGTVTVAKYTPVLPTASISFDIALSPSLFIYGYTLEFPYAGPTPPLGSTPSFTSPLFNLPLPLNTWSINAALPSGSYDINCFDWAMKLNVGQLVLSGLHIPDADRTLFAYDPSGAGSPFVIDDCYDACTSVVTTVTDGHCNGCRAMVSATFTNCNKVTVSSCKTIRQVVLVYNDCTRDYFDMLTGTIYTFNAPTGKAISHVFVRSGCRGQGIPHSQDLIDTNGHSYPNVRRYQLNGNCLAPACL